MGKIRILYNPPSDKATLSGGSWLSSMPLTNMQKGQLSSPARSNGVGFASTLFYVDFGVPTRIDHIIFAGHNFSPTASQRFTVADDAAFTVNAVVVGGWIVRGMDGGRLVWAPDVGPTARYLRVELRDSANPQGYIQIGRFMAGPAWSPAINFSWGAGFQWVDESTFARSVGGQTYADVRPKYRRLTCAFDALSDAEAWGDYPSVYDMMKTLGTTGNLFAIYDPEDINHPLGGFMLPRRSIYGRLAELAPLNEVMPDAKPHSWALTVEELL